MKQENFTSSHGIRDNRERGSVGADFLRRYLRKGTDLSIVSAYFTINAYEYLKDELESIKGLRFLFGEPSLVGVKQGDQETKAFQLTDQGLSLANQLEQSRLAKACSIWIQEKVQIRSMQQGDFLHGKMYHLQNDGASSALLGSSNFTAAGLGRYGGNVELNLIVDSDRDRQELLSWFEQWWEDDERTEDVKEHVLRELKRLYDNHPPQFIYYLTLFHLFRDDAEDDDSQRDQMEGLKLPDTQIWEKLYQFQKDGAKSAINKLLRLNGCILADSVGLGKTFTALAVIKYFELRNERVLVLCPKKLHRNWSIYRQGNDLRNILSEDRFDYDLLAHTDLSRTSGTSDTGMDLANVNWGGYSLVVIDESHNFRNNRYAGEEGKQTRYEKLIKDIIGSGSKTKVLLLSATPVNNELSDIRNQISLIAGGDVSRVPEADAAFAASQTSLGIPSVKETTRIAQKYFTDWARAAETSERTTSSLLEVLGGDFFHMLDGLLIARSRSNIKYAYAEEMGKLGGFPNRPTPQSIYSPLDLLDGCPSFEEIEGKISQLSLALYNPTEFLREDLDEDTRLSYEAKIHGVFTQMGRERILVGMMKTNFLKRLESSVDSFRHTLERTIDKANALLDKLNSFAARDTNTELNDSDVNPDALDEEDEELVVGKKRKVYLGHIDIARWRECIENDQCLLKGLLNKTRIVNPERDAKLAQLCKLIQDKLHSPNVTKDGRENRKVLVFTAYADTASYLYENLESAVRSEGCHIALVRGDGNNRNTLGGNEFGEILDYFSPRSRMPEREPEDEEIDVLIATDCISEGQNLQDCDIVVNYDIHWNPVRIIQRFGRIDRIGSKNSEVHLVNFWPVEDLDNYLNLKHRVQARMALVDATATQSDNLLTQEGLEELVTKDIQLQNQQLHRLQEEVLDLEELDEAGINLSDFSLEEFRNELMQFLKADRQALESAPLGLYTVVQADPDIPARPGAVFCLRQREREGSEMASNESGINPLGRHYLVYVHDDGEVRLTFTYPKQILDLLRRIAAGHEQALAELCDLFDRNTEHGMNLQHYDDLIEKTLQSIANVYSRCADRNLASGRDGRLPLTSSRPTRDEEDYELLTWFVIIAPEETVS